MTRTPVRRRRAVAMLLLAVVVTAVLTVLGGHAGAGTETRVRGERSYTVRDGDTVWAIAARHAGGHDVRAVVDAILAANGVDPGAIAPGLVLRIPTDVG